LNEMNVTSHSLNCKEDDDDEAEKLR